ITTVAGNGSAGFSGDGGPAVSASIYQPEGVAVDAAGNLYIADSGNNRIRRVNPQGVIQTVAGNGAAGFDGDGGPAISAVLDQPEGLAIGNTGHIYVAESENNRIREIVPGGTITTVAGNGTAGYSGDSGPATAAELSFPLGVAVDATGD